MFGTELQIGRSGKHWVALISAVTFVPVGLWYVTSCASHIDPGGDSATHFWETCDEDEQCGANFQCICGRCTEACNRDADCRVQQAVCVAAASLPECRVENLVCATAMARDAGSADNSTSSSLTDAATVNVDESEHTTDTSGTSDAGRSGATDSSGEIGSASGSNDGGPNAFWSPILGIETSASFAFSPLVTLDAEGNATSIWSAGTEQTGYSIAASRYLSGQGWSEASTLATSADFLARPCLAGNPDGAAVAAWTEESDSGAMLWTAVFARETGWSEALAIGAPSGPINQIACVMDAAGNALLVWSAYEGEQSILRAARFEPLGWSQPQRLDQSELNAFEVSLAVDGVGNALVLWNAWLGDQSELWSSRYLVNDGWHEPTLLPTTAGQSLVGLDVVLAADGGGMAVWGEQASDGSNHTAWVMAFTTEGSWEQPEVLVSGADAISNLTVGFTGLETAVATWEAFEQTASPQQNRIFARSKSSVGWALPVLLAEDAAHVSLSVSPTGYAVAAWRTPLDYMVDGDIAVSYFSERYGWSESTALAEDAVGDSVGAYVSVNDNGQACVVWQQAKASQQDDILSVRTDELLVGR